MNGGRMPDAPFWGGKRVLLTGHTGFKGGWLALWLRQLGAQVVGFSLPPNSSPNLFDLARVGELVESHIGDVRDVAAVAAVMKSAKPDVVFHLAAQPLVRRSYRDPLLTFDTNAMGTANVLDAVRRLPATRVVVAITTDKVYDDGDALYPHRETDALGGHDPYSASKAAAELVIASYRRSYLQASGVALASARAGNVIGGGDWSEDRLLPDAVRAWSAKKPLSVRRPQAVRPWQHVLEPLAGYLVLAEALWEQPSLAGAYNFGPGPSEVATVREVVELARVSFAQSEVKWGDGSDGPNETQRLELETIKARKILDIRNRWRLEEIVRRAMLWYRRQLDGEDARKLCQDDLRSYEELSPRVQQP